MELWVQSLILSGKNILEKLTALQTAWRIQERNCWDGYVSQWRYSLLIKSKLSKCSAVPSHFWAGEKCWYIFSYYWGGGGRDDTSKSVIVTLLNLWGATAPPAPLPPPLPPLGTALKWLCYAVKRNLKYRQKFQLQKTLAILKVSFLNLFDTKSRVTVLNCL